MSKLNIKKYYKQLEGAKINKFVGFNPNRRGNDFPCFHVTLSNGDQMKLEISSDMEGNNGGFIFQSHLKEVSNA
jgi:hypothetical protein